MKTPQEMVSELVRAGFRQIDVSKETGIHKATISRLFLGHNQEISFVRMDALKECHRKFMAKALRAQAKRAAQTETETA